MNSQVNANVVHESEAQRQHARVKIPAKLRFFNTDRTPTEARVIDLSAGGIRFSGESSYEADEEVICHFELPGSLCFVLPARIVRSPEAEADATTTSDTDCVACEFVGLDEANRSQLLRWVYREQVRRHRDASRE